MSGTERPRFDAANDRSSNHRSIDEHICRMRALNKELAMLVWAARATATRTATCSVEGADRLVLLGNQAGWPIESVGRTATARASSRDTRLVRTSNLENTVLVYAAGQRSSTYPLIDQTNGRLSA